MMKRIAALSMVFLSATCAAAQTPHAGAAHAGGKPVAVKTIAKVVEDFTGDGIADEAKIETDGDSATFIISRGGTLGLSMMGGFELKGASLKNPGSVSVKDGGLVLKVSGQGQDATYFYRYEAKQQAMRLMSLHATRNAKNPLVVDWDLIGGKYSVTRGQKPPDEMQQKSEPVWLNKTPSMDEILNPEAGSGEDRD